MTEKTGWLAWPMVWMFLMAVCGWASPPAATLPVPDASFENFTTQHYRFFIASESDAAGREVVRDLEALWSFYRSTLGAILPLRPDPGRVTVYYFTHPRQMASFLRQIPAAELDASFPGLPRSSREGFMVMDASGLLGRSDLAIILHGAAHLCHERFLYDDGVSGSWWVREGLASYFMQTRFDRDDRFRYGEIRSSEGYIEDISPGGRTASRFTLAEEPKRELKKIRSLYKQGRHIPLAELLDHPAGAAWPDLETRDRAAVESWILMHFLVHGQRGELRERLALFLERERHGEGGKETFRKTISGDLRVFEAVMYRYVKRMA
ncbi:MAG: hypothetical protein ACE5HD_08445 [Acidobacteriota bacterium]